MAASTGSISTPHLSSPYTNPGISSQKNFFTKARWWTAYGLQFLSAQLMHPTTKLCQSFVSLQLPENQTSPIIKRIKQVFFICIGIMLLVPTIVSVAFKALSLLIQKDPYLYIKGRGQEKSPSHQISLSFFNISGLPFGLDVASDGMRPLSERMDGIIRHIVEQDRDIVCLQEVFTEKAGFDFASKLKAHYPHCYINIGPKLFGLNSGHAVFSKYPVSSFEFIPFGETNHDRVNRGFVHISLPHAHVYTTHLSPSDKEWSPTPDEKTLRRKQLQIIEDHIKHLNDENVSLIALGGDFNMPQEEYEESGLDFSFINTSQEDAPTCSNADYIQMWQLDDQPFYSLTLDYALIYRNQCHFLLPRNPQILCERSLSDHNDLFVNIEVV